MKKYYSVLVMLAMMVAALSFTACGGDDDSESTSSSALVGTWDVVSNIRYSPYDSEEENVKGVYWVFTANKLTVYDKEDVLNGKAVSYTYDSSTKKLAVAGISIYTVQELSSSTLKMRSESLYEGWYNIITFRKR